MFFSKPRNSVFLKNTYLNTKQNVRKNQKQRVFEGRGISFA